jgi:RND family efflux transporter MFP subunit
MLDNLFESITGPKVVWRWVGIATIVLVLSIFATRVFAYWRLKEHTLTDSLPVVNTITATKKRFVEKIYLPGKVMTWHSAKLYARANGYLKLWKVDIGDHVKQGDVLAVIDCPDLDAQFEEAKSLLKISTVQNQLAQITAKRWTHLVKTDFVSKQATDDKLYGAASYAAEVFREKANLNKLEALVGFETVVAPFEGVISARQTDVGNLVSVGSNLTENQPMFELVQADKLRLYVNVPQTYADKITENMEVFLQFSEHPGQVFSAKLLNTAKNIDSKLQTLQAEFWIDNHDGKLLPGGYTRVELRIEHSDPGIILPVNTLIFQAAGLQVAKVDATGRVVLTNIEIATDYGKTVRVDHGIEPGENIILNPPDSLFDGQQVQKVDVACLEAMN